MFFFSTYYYGMNASHHKGFAMNQQTVGKAQVCFTSDGESRHFGPLDIPNTQVDLHNLSTMQKVTGVLQQAIEVL